MRVSFLVLVAASIGGCTDGSRDGRRAEAGAGKHRTTDAAPSPQGEQGTAACERLSTQAIRDVPGLRLVGQAGPYRFFGDPRALLCSEPGPGGVGECEIVGSTTIRVEGGSDVFGLRPRAGHAAILVYGPGGISCRLRR
jgi:hypothetical protein